MKKRILILFIVSFVVFQANAQSDSSKLNSAATKADSTNPDYLVELNNRTNIIGKKVSDDGREIGILTTDKGLILIPKYEIKSISLAKYMPTVAGQRVFPNPHPSRYFYSPSGIPLKKGEGYLQSIFYLAFQGQYAITDHWSIGATTTLWTAPFLLNAKYTNTLKTDSQDKHNIYLAAGVQAGTFSYIWPGAAMGIGYAGLTFGNPESNITINAGVLGFTEKDYVYHYSPTGSTYEEVRLNTASPAVSVSWNTRVNSTVSFMGEVWYVQNTIVGGPGMRFYSGRKNAIDVAILGAFDLDWGAGIFGIPMVSWTRKLGGK